MPTSTEAQIGIEPVARDPFHGEDESWIPQDKYESATPVHWQSLPVSYFQRSGINSIILEDVAEDSIFKPLTGESSDASTTIIPDVSIHLRSDGLYIWSPSKSQGLCIPVTSIATSAPVRSSVSLPSLPDAAPVVRLDLIPDTDAMDMGEDGFAPSLLLHIAFAPDSTPTEASSTNIDSDSADAPPTPSNPCQTLADVSSLSPDQIRTGMDRPLQAFLTALQRCQEQLPDDQADSEDEEGMDRRIRLPPIHAGSAVIGGGASMDGASDQVRIPELEGFGGWVTSENVEEVMRTHGIDVNGQQDGVDGVELGPGAGSRRQREEDEDGEADGERVTIWQRTDAA